jgi:hypothetical protein
MLCLLNDAFVPKRRDLAGEWWCEKRQLRHRTTKISQGSVERLARCFKSSKTLQGLKVSGKKIEYTCRSRTERKYLDGMFLSLCCESSELPSKLLARGCVTSPTGVRARMQVDGGAWQLKLPARQTQHLCCGKRPGLLTPEGQSHGTLTKWTRGHEYAHVEEIRTLAMSELGVAGTTSAALARHWKLSSLAKPV